MGGGKARGGKDGRKEGKEKRKGGRKEEGREDSRQQRATALSCLVSEGRSLNSLF